MITKWELIVVIFLLMLIGFYAVYSKNQLKKNFTYETKKMKINERTIVVKIANTDEKRAKGLMFVEKMSDEEGMLFEFGTTGLHTFWMKNTLIPLDILWLDENYKVVHFIENAKPCPKGINCEIYVPKTLARYVLELNGGWIQKYCGNIADVQILEI